MKSMFLRLAVCFLAVSVLMACILPSAVQAENPNDSKKVMAQDISGTAVVTSCHGFDQIHRLFDGIETSGISGYVLPGETSSITLEYADGIGSLYLIFHTLNPYTITDNSTGTQITAGENEYYHQFVDLVELFGYTPVSVTLDFGSDPVTLNELYIFTGGEVPDFVQKWNAPADGKTDLLLLSAHGDDEQLFFAGILPYYAKELGYQVQVVYMTSHQNTEPYRVHEMLNGLWAVGVDTYPVFAEFYDFSEYVFNQKYEIDYVYSWYANQGQPQEYLLDFVVEQLRRFKPQVVVTHDFAGEYGHPQHVICADLMAEAITISNDAGNYPESAETYGLWDTPKAYFHLYEQNQIVMDWDQPLESFGGMTAFQVTQKLGFPCHTSQYSYFEWYLSHRSSAAAVPYYNPCYYGLYRSTVGEDVKKNDFFENVLTYAQQERLAEEARAEQERLAAEQAAEEARKAEEAAKKAAEEAAAAEAARQAAMEARLAEEAAQLKNAVILGVSAAVAVLCLISVFFFFLIRKKKLH